MARRKPAEQGEELVNPAEEQAPQAEGQAAGAGEASDAAPARKSTGSHDFLPGRTPKQAFTSAKIARTGA